MSLLHHELPGPNTGKSKGLPQVRCPDINNGLLVCKVSQNCKDEKDEITVEANVDVMTAISVVTCLRFFDAAEHNPNVRASFDKALRETHIGEERLSSLSFAENSNTTQAHSELHEQDTS